MLCKDCRYFRSSDPEMTEDQLVARLIKGKAFSFAHHHTVCSHPEQQYEDCITGEKHMLNCRDLNENQSCTSGEAK